MRAKCSAFPLVKLVVLIAIIGILVALLVTTTGRRVYLSYLPGGIWRKLIAKPAGILCTVLCSCCITGAQHLPDKSHSHSAYRPFDIRTIDPALFKDAYAILGMERLMHPIDMADWPLKIGSERQLFVDDFLIASCQGLTRQLHQPIPHPDNSVMKTREHLILSS